MTEPYRVTLRLNDKKFTVVNEKFPGRRQAEREAVYLIRQVEEIVKDDYSLIQSAGLSPWIHSLLKRISARSTSSTCEACST